MLDFLTYMTIWGSVGLVEGGQTVGSPRVLISKQIGTIGRIKKRLKKCIKRVRWSTQWSFCSIGAGSAVVWWGAVWWGRSAAGRGQRRHSWRFVVAFQTCSGVEDKLLLLMNETSDKLSSNASFHQTLTKNLVTRSYNLLLTILWALLGSFIKPWCIVGLWSKAWAILYHILHSAINGNLSNHLDQEYNGQTDKEWRPLLIYTHIHTWTPTQ